MSAVEQQYEEICDHPDCDRVLDIDCPIMCYEDSDGEEKTLCNDCYREADYWKTDCNEDNEEEIEEHKKAEATKIFKKHYAENPILDPTRISMLGKVDGFGVRDNNGNPTPHSYYEGLLNTYYVFRRMGQTAWVEVSPNNQDSVYGKSNKNKIHKRYKLQRIIDDVQMKRVMEDYDMTAKLFKYCNLEEIKKKNEKPKTKKLVKIQKKNV